jgi:malic enzyme
MLQITNILQLRQLTSDIDRYEALRQLQQDDAPLFWSLVWRNTEEVLPWLYTPTVGRACQEYCQRGFATRGLFISAADSGRWVLSSVVMGRGRASASCITGQLGHGACGDGGGGGGG